MRSAFICGSGNSSGMPQSPDHLLQQRYIIILQHRRIQLHAVGSGSRLAVSVFADNTGIRYERPASALAVAYGIFIVIPSVMGYLSAERLCRRFCGLTSGQSCHFYFDSEIPSFDTVKISLQIFTSLIRKKTAFPLHFKIHFGFFIPADFHFFFRLQRLSFYLYFRLKRNIKFIDLYRTDIFTLFKQTFSLSMRIRL